MKIKAFALTIEPWHFDRRQSELRMRLMIDFGQTVEFVKPLIGDDLTSRFDQIFDQAKYCLKKELGLILDAQGKP